MEKYLVLISYILTLTFFGAVMSANEKQNPDNLIYPKRGYTLYIQAEGFRMRAYINGAPSYTQVRLEKKYYGTIPLNEVMKAGRNKVVLDLEPINFEDKNYTPNENSFLKVSLNPSKDVYSSYEIDLFWGQYDMKTKNLVPMYEYLGFKANFKDGPYLANWHYILESVNMQYNTDKVPSQTPYTQRLTFYFDVPSDETFEILPWKNAPVLKDTPKLRTELMRAYEKFWSPYQNRDIQGVRDQAELYFRRVAASSGFESIDDFLANSKIREGQLGKPSEIALPISWPPSSSNLSLLFNDESNMVTIQPSPLITKNADDQLYLSVPYYFFRNSKGVLQMGHQQEW